MKRGNWLTTLGGILAALGAVPITLGAEHVKMPGWLYMVCIFSAAIGPVIIGVAAKGKDEHSTTTEVQASTKAQMNQ